MFLLQCALVGMFLLDRLGVCAHSGFTGGWYTLSRRLVVVSSAVSSLATSNKGSSWVPQFSGLLGRRNAGRLFPG